MHSGRMIVSMRISFGAGGRRLIRVSEPKNVYSSSELGCEYTIAIRPVCRNTEGFTTPTSGIYFGGSSR